MARIRITDPNKIEAVIAKLDQQWSIAEDSERLFSYIIPTLKEKIQGGETIYIETRMECRGNGIQQILSYYSDKDIPTDIEFLNQKQP